VAARLERSAIGREPAPVSFRLVSGEHGTLTRGEILLHIVKHATYHSRSARQRAHEIETACR
jgi:hypothetical protein